MKTKKGLYYLPIALIFTSCGQFIYHSTTVHNALLTKRNDFNVQINQGGAGSEAYVAYSPFNYFGLSAGAASLKVSDTQKLNNYRFNSFEFSVFPYYAKDEFRFECPVGINITNKKSLNGQFSTYAPYTQKFVTPTFGFGWPDFEMALFCRVSHIEYANKDLGIDTRYEPGLMVRGATKNFKAMMQVRFDAGTNYSKSSSSTVPYEQQAEYFPFHLSMGLSINFNALDLRKKH
jgi:hypothetical protein